MVCFGTPVWADRIRRGGDAGMAGFSRLVAIGEQGLNSFAVAVNLGDDGTLVGGLLAGELGAAGGSAKLGTKAGAAALGTKALAEAFKAFVDGADIFSVTGAIGGAGHIFSLAYFRPPLAILVSITLRLWTARPPTSL